MADPYPPDEVRDRKGPGDRDIVPPDPDPGDDGVGEGDEVESGPETRNPETDPPPGRPAPEWGEQELGQFGIGLLTLEISQFLDGDTFCRHPHHSPAAGAGLGI